MRVISQNGLYDIPYELSVINLSDNAIFARIGGQSILLGRYETEERAGKVFDEISHEYSKYYRADGGQNPITGAVFPAGAFDFPKVYFMPEE